MESKKLLNALGMVSYAFVKSKENGGTVNNVIQGLERARGKYVRVIAPGDCLYAEDTLCHICNFMRKNNAKETFGKIAGYSEERNYAVNVQIPLDTSIYNDKKDVYLEHGFSESKFDWLIVLMNRKLEYVNGSFETDHSFEWTGGFNFIVTGIK